MSQNLKEKSLLPDAPGTSQVSGAAGLLFSLEPAASVTEVREALLAGAEIGRASCRERVLACV